MTFKLHEAEAIIMLSKSPGMDIIRFLQENEIKQEESYQLGRDKKSTLEDFVQGSATIRGMKRLSLNNMISEAKITLEKLRKTKDD